MRSGGVSDCSAMKQFFNELGHTAANVLSIFSINELSLRFGLSLYAKAEVNPFVT
jgi:hypothetical protein